ncbi:MAG TPA: hypothetical protein VKU60_20985, partial [Chloroflexota bacterium]|nr:hypothetical protein [Chloroflexota bacterium]
VEALDEFVEAAPEAGPAAESEIAAQSAEDGDAADMFVASVTIGEPDESEAAQAEPSPEGEETNNPFLSAASEIDTAGLPDAGVEANSEAMEEESPSGAAAAFFGQVPASDEPSTEAADQSDEDSAPISGGSAVDSIEVVDATPTEVVPEDVLAPHEVAPERLESRPPAAILPDDVLAPHESPVAEAAQMEAEPARSELAVLGISQDEVPASDLTETQPSAGDTPLGEARTDSLEPEAADPDVPSLQARGNVKVEVLEGDRQGAKFLGKSTLLGATGAHCLLDGFDLPVGTKVKFSLIAPRFSDQIDIYDAIVLVASGDSGKVDVQLAFSTRHDDVDKFVARHFGGKAGFSLFGRFRR